MPTAMTFASLQDELRGYLERGGSNDPTVEDELPRIINNAERDIAKDLKILGFVTSLTSTLQANVSVYDKPARWLSTASMMFNRSGTTGNDRGQLFLRSLEYCRLYWPNSDETDLPEFYADYDHEHWLVVPTPAIDYSWEIMAWMMPALLDAVVTTNWLTQYAPNLLRAKVLEYGFSFVKEYDRAGFWKSNYAEQKGMTNIQDLKRIADRNTSKENA